MSDGSQKQSAAIELMRGFAERTGLVSKRPPIRYLWTDAFAVCNLLGLARVTGEGEYLNLALRLVDQVHHTLGRHRSDDHRTGWISGLGETEGATHPTRGGLRIGKRLPERTPGEGFDEQGEWDRDGQYFHYLTKWMRALDQVSRFTRQRHFNVWARELAETAYAAFSSLGPASGRRQMVWKMSIDLSRPLVSSMGQHDPLDGYITCAQLRSTASELSSELEGPSLQRELAGFAAMTAGVNWETADPLGLGGLLMDACLAAQLGRKGALADRDLLPTLLSAALGGIRHYAAQGDLREPAERRLAFRELGLAIGLQALRLIQKDVRAEPDRFSRGGRTLRLLEALEPYAPMGAAIQSFWLSPRNRDTRTWVEHRDINDVMLATSLAPEGFLILLPLD